MASVFKQDFELHHAIEHRVSKCYAILDPNGYRQWAIPSLRVFILKDLNTEGLACETRTVTGPTHNDIRLIVTLIRVCGAD
jgi:hypothetical protein